MSHIVPGRYCPHIQVTRHSKAFRTQRIVINGVHVVHEIADNQCEACTISR